MEEEAKDEHIQETVKSIRMRWAKDHGERRQWILAAVVSAADAEAVTKTKAQQKAKREVKWGDMDEHEGASYREAMDVE